MTSTLDNAFSTIVADLLFGQMRESGDAEQALLYRRNIFRTIREYTSVIGNYNRNIESLIQLLQNTSGSANTLENPMNISIPESRGTTNVHGTTNVPRATPPPANTQPTTDDMNIDEPNADSTTTETETPETDTTYFSSTPYDSLREFENITRLWGRPRTTPSRQGSASANLFSQGLSQSLSQSLSQGLSQGLSQSLFPGFTREYTYFFNMPITNTTSEEGLTLEEIRRETLESVYDASYSSSSQCPISFDEFEPGECVLQIRRCGHIFKPEELRRWLTRHTGCPVCRCDLHSVTEDYTNEQPNINSFEIRSSEFPRTPIRASREVVFAENGLNNEDSSAVDYSDLPDLIDPDSENE